MNQPAVTFGSSFRVVFAMLLGALTAIAILALASAVAPFYVKNHFGSFQLLLFLAAYLIAGAVGGSAIGLIRGREKIAKGIVVTILTLLILNVLLFFSPVVQRLVADVGKIVYTDSRSDKAFKWVTAELEAASESSSQGALIDERPSVSAP